MDLNILISTIVTATATLVAIIGGFLVSRVITMVSERKSIERRIKELKNDLSSKKEIYEKAEQALLEEDADEFILKYLEELIDAQNSLTNIIEKNNYVTRSSSELEPYVEAFNKMVSEVNTMLKGKYRNEISDDFEEFIKSEQLRLNQPSKVYLYEYIYSELKENLPEKKTNNGLFGSYDFVPYIPNPSTNLSHINYQEYQDKVKTRDSLKDEVRVLSLQLQEQKRILDAFANPKGFWGGLLVLFYASIVGVAYPTTLLPYPSNYYNDVSTKWLLVSLFISQLVALFFYLAYEIYKMTTFNKNKDH